MTISPNSTPKMLKASDRGYPFQLLALIIHAAASKTTTGSSWRCWLAVVGLAWVSLWVWGRSPYARFLEHDAFVEVSGEGAALLVFFLAGWTLMVFAMMLPTSLPLIALFHRMVSGRAGHLRLVVLLIGGYITVWAGFGTLVHIADLAIHQGTANVAVFDSGDRAIGAAILALAGGVPVHAIEAALSG